MKTNKRNDVIQPAMPIEIHHSLAIFPKQKGSNNQLITRYREQRSKSFKISS